MAIQASPRDAERAVDERLQGARHRMRGRAPVQRTDLAAPPAQLGFGNGRIADFVDGIVDLAAVGVNRGDRAPRSGGRNRNE
jgi:hypothetical protein